MSTRRFSPRKRIRRDREGRFLCFWCDQPTPTGDPRWCGPECEHEYRIRRSQAYLLSCLWERDRGICALCGVDTEEQRRELNRRAQKTTSIDEYFEIVDGYGVPFNRIARRPPGQWTPPLIHRLWDGDHILGVCEGGGECGLENLRTLCFRCHRKDTGEVLRRVAKAKREARERERERVRREREEAARQQEAARRARLIPCFVVDSPQMQRKLFTPSVESALRMVAHQVGILDGGEVLTISLRHVEPEFLASLPKADLPWN